MFAPSAALTEAFRDALKASATAQRDAAEAELTAVHEELHRLSRRLVTLDRQLVAQTRRVQALPDRDRIAESAAAELARVLAVPGVQSVEVAGMALHVLTGPVRIDWQGATYGLGVYRIVLDLAGDLRIESVDRLGPKPGWDHPHVQDGRPCLGNLREGILKLIAEYELALAVQVALGFLATYQPESAYCSVEGWPLTHVAG